MREFSITDDPQVAECEQIRQQLAAKRQALQQRIAQLIAAAKAPRTHQDLVSRALAGDVTSISQELATARQEFNQVLRAIAANDQQLAEARRAASMRICSQLASDYRAVVQRLADTARALAQAVKGEAEFKAELAARGVELGHPLPQLAFARAVFSDNGALATLLANASDALAKLPAAAPAAVPVAPAAPQRPATVPEPAEVVPPVTDAATARRRAARRLQTAVRGG